MKYYNIERSVFPGRQYVGYSADGRSWRITGKHGNWNASAAVTKQGALSRLVGYERLAEISRELYEIK